MSSVAWNSLHGVSAVASLLTDFKGAFALDECSELLTFRKSDFAQTDMKREMIERMRQGLIDQIEGAEIQQEVLYRRSRDKELDKTKKKKPRELSGLKKSLGNKKGFLDFQKSLLAEDTRFGSIL